MLQVSVIVLTYNPDKRKLLQTLSAAASQKDISFEIIISDDGSVKKDFSFLPEYMETLGVKNWSLLEHEQNRGTVQSCLSAVNASVGEYVFLTSPGDFLFDSYALRDFYRFAEENNASVCFGNTVFYCAQDDVPRTTRTYGNPAQPDFYAPDRSATVAKTNFFGGSWIIGASYFRRRACMLSCLQKISETAVYMEDTPTTAFALAEGERLCYYDRNIVWYEDGTGVSTGANEKWNKLLHKDVLKSFEKLKVQYPKDPYVDIAYRNISQENRLRRIAENLLRHPVIMTRIAVCRKAKKKPILCTQADMQRLSALLKTK